MRRTPAEATAACRQARPPIVQTCAHCGGSFEWWQRRKYCSLTCNNAARKRGDWLVCAECSGRFFAKASEIGKGRKYCSRACLRKNSGLTPEQYAAQGDRMSIARRGAANPAFKHGKYGNRARRSTFNLAAKGEQCCRNCGSRVYLQLHHAIPRSMYRAGRDEILNGVPLCGVCHTSWHRRGKVVLYRDIFTASEWAYLSTAQLTGQSVTAWLDERYPIRDRREDHDTVDARAYRLTTHRLGTDYPAWAPLTEESA